MASCKSSRPTRSIISDCRAGISNAPTTPAKAASASSHSMLICPVQVSHQSSVASTSRRLCARVTSFSLSARSTTTPAGKEKSRIGIDPAKATRPTRKALSVSWSASQPCAIDCIHVPTSDSVCPIQKRRKFRWVARTRNGLRERPAAAEGIGRESCRSGESLPRGRTHGRRRRTRAMVEADGWADDMSQAAGTGGAGGRSDDDRATVRYPDRSA
jgi:hypothetical protein